jgi:hypothetical protein
MTSVQEDPLPRDPLKRFKNDFPDPGLVQVSRRGTVGGFLPSLQDFVGGQGVCSTDDDSSLEAIRVPFECPSHYILLSCASCRCRWSHGQQETPTLRSLSFPPNLPALCRDLACPSGASASLFLISHFAIRHRDFNQSGEAISKKGKGAARKVIYFGLFNEFVVLSHSFKIEFGGNHGLIS